MTALGVSHLNRCRLHCDCGPQREQLSAHLDVRKPFRNIRCKLLKMQDQELSTQSVRKLVISNSLTLHSSRRSSRVTCAMRMLYSFAPTVQLPACSRC